MYLVELVLIALNLVLVGVNIHLGFKCYNRYVLLPTLRAERARTLEMAYLRVAGLHAKRIKAVNDKISKSRVKATRARIIKIGRKVLGRSLPYLEKKAA